MKGRDINNSFADIAFFAIDHNCGDEPLWYVVEMMNAHGRYLNMLFSGFFGKSSDKKDNIKTWSAPPLPEHLRRNKKK